MTSFISTELNNIENWLRNKVAEELELAPEEIAVDEELTTFGLDSMHAVSISGDLEDFLGREVSSTLLWDFPTIKEIAQHLEGELALA